MRDISVIIAAAGSGKRMGRKSFSKALIRLNSKPLLTYILDKFSSLPWVKEIIIAIKFQDWRQAERLVSEYKSKTLPEIKLVKGGKERCDSVSNALKITSPTSQIILIHDVARPVVKTQNIIRLIKTVRKDGAAILAVPIIDTIKRVNPAKAGVIKETLPRHELWAAQTPQGFKRNILLKAYTKHETRNTKHEITDDASLVENLGYPVKIVPGSYDNIKITTPDDMIFVQGLLSARKSRLKSGLHTPTPLKRGFSRSPL